MATQTEKDRIIMQIWRDELLNPEEAPESAKFTKPGEFYFDCIAVMDQCWPDEPVSVRLWGLDKIDTVLVFSRCCGEIVAPMIPDVRKAFQDIGVEAYVIGADDHRIEQLLDASKFNFPEKHFKKKESDKEFKSLLREISYLLDTRGVITDNPWRV